MRAAAALALALALALVAARARGAQEGDLLPETVVVAERRLPGDRPIAEWAGPAIAEFAPRTIDELLATEPSFSLYRRQSSLFGNPTSAGVSLRNLGATAASRTLVLRDGIPQNDPFGGWIHWARYDPAGLASARIVPSAQAAVWGNQSPAGVIHLNSLQAGGGDGRVQLGAGSNGTFGLSAGQGMVSSDGSAALRASLFALESGGFYSVDPAQRGPIDQRLDLINRGADLRAAWQPADQLWIEPTISWYDERRGNGTPLTGNATEAVDVGLRVRGEGPDVSWEALAYWQRRRFDAMFSSVDAERESESPSLDQFDVPGSGLGGGFTASWQPNERWTLVGGCDVRHLSGETNEDAGFAGGRYIRRRKAGGEQTLAGMFSRSSWQIGDDSRLDASARLDLWSIEDGSRVEFSHATGALLRADGFPDRDGFEPSLSLEGSRRIGESLELSASAGSTFRLPTINELYRPYRVRNDITEANAALDPERFVSVEAGAAWTPDGGFSLGIDLFHHWVSDAIANVPITDPAEAAEIAGFVPPGGTVAQRRNVDRAAVWGCETKASWRPDDRFALTLAWLFSKSEFTESARQPLLEGNPFPQAPEHRLIGGLEAEPTERLQLFAQLEYGSHQFDDALARQRLGSWWNFRLGGSFELAEDFTLHARIENLFDEEITTGLSGSGLRSIGTPRSLWVALETTW